MATPDPILIVEQKLWSLLLAWPALTDPTDLSYVRPGNRVRFDVLRIKWPDLQKTVKGAADAPELRIEPTDGRMDPNAPRTLCGQSLIRTVTFAHTIIGGDRTINRIGFVRADIEACYLASGSQLGIPATVAKYEMSFRYQPTPPQQAGGAATRQVVLNLAVTIKG